VWDLLAVLSAAFNALGSVLQDRGARHVPDADAMSLRMIGELARNRATLGGIAALTVGVGLQAAALNGAPLTLVEPILVAELPIAMVLAAALFGARLDRRAWGGVILTAGGLAALLWAASPSGGDVHRAGATGWILTLTCAAAACAILIVLARGTRPGARAALIGAAAGIGHGVSATLMKAASVAGSSGVVALLGTWQLYGTLVVGGGSLYLYQNALQAGPLAAAQPALGVADPGVAACCGVLLFGEQIRGGALIAVQLAGLAAVIAGMVALSMSSSAIGQSRGARRPQQRRGAHADGARDVVAD
jgi:drug/metabolite transporter (DMT)-like permease